MSPSSGIVNGIDGHTRLYWEASGRGAPVLLVHGLGLSGGAWWRTVDALAPRMRVITFDHRGIGRSESFAYAYTTEAMADDAVSILDGVPHTLPALLEALQLTRKDWAGTGAYGRSSCATCVSPDRMDSGSGPCRACGTSHGRLTRDPNRGRRQIKRSRTSVWGGRR